VHLIINIGYDDWIIENYKIKKYLISNAFLGGIKRIRQKTITDEQKKLFNNILDQFENYEMK